MKRNLISGIIAIAAGVALIAGIIIYGLEQYSKMPKNFATNQRALGEKLYASVTEYDLLSNYPETPEDVMGIFVALRQLLYGKIVINDDLFKELIDIQRNLMSYEMTQAQSAEEQYEVLMSALSLLNENSVYLFRAEKGMPRYTTKGSNEVEVCIVPVTEYMLNYDTLYWNYFLTQDSDGRWKVFMWEQADGNFRALTD